MQNVVMKQQTLDDYIQQVLRSEYSSDHLDFEDDMKINKDSESNTTEVTQNSLFPDPFQINSSDEQ